MRTKSPRTLLVCTAVVGAIATAFLSQPDEQSSTDRGVVTTNPSHDRDSLVYMWDTELQRQVVIDDVSNGMGHHHGHNHGHHHPHDGADHHHTDDLVMPNDGDLFDGIDVDGKVYLVSYKPDNADGESEMGKWKYRGDLGLMSESLDKHVDQSKHGQTTSVVANERVTKVQGEDGLTILASLDPKNSKWLTVKVECRDENEAKLWVGVNSHGICTMQQGDREIIIIADNRQGYIWFVDYGKKRVIARLDTPMGNEFDREDVNAYYAGVRKRNAEARKRIADGGAPSAKENRIKRIPFTGVAALDGFAYASTGYDGAGDFVLGIKFDDNGMPSWDKLAYGKRGQGPHDFVTAHGLFADADSHILMVASRENSRSYLLKRVDGKLVEVDVHDLAKTEGMRSRNCHGMTHAGLTFYALLDPTHVKTHASVLIYKGKKRVGILTPGTHHDDVKHKVRVHGIHVFTAPNANGKDTLWAIADIWPGGGKQEGGLVIFERVESSDTSL